VISRRPDEELSIPEALARLKEVDRDLDDRRPGSVERTDTDRFKFILDRYDGISADELRAVMVADSIEEARQLIDGIMDGRDDRRNA
jgi:hypothetical protein